MRRYRWALFESPQLYPAGAGFGISGQVPLGKGPGLFAVSGTQEVYSSVHSGGMPQSSYLRSISRFLLVKCYYKVEWEELQSIPHSANVSASISSYPRLAGYPAHVVSPALL